MKRIFAAVMTVVLSICCVFSAFAESAGYMIGDADRDNDVTVLDATAIQRRLADLIGEDALSLPASDADGDGNVTVLDATAIQRWLVGFEAGKDIGTVVSDENQRREIEVKIRDYVPQKGIDVSSHNGDVDMNKVKAAGFTFVMIRLGYGDDMTSQDDTRFEQNVRKAEAAGLDWGAYIYSYALSVDEAKSEVQHTLRLLKDKHPTMPIAFDMEDDSYKNKYGMPTDEMLRTICDTYLSEISAAGYYPMLYSSLNWLNTKLNDKALLNKYDLWVAQWNTTLQYQTDNVGMWQYGGEVNYIDTPQIDGLTGNFDKNRCYKNYPVIITAYGYNNHHAMIEQKQHAAVSAPPEDYVPMPVPDGYDGVMGESLRNGRN